MTKSIPFRAVTVALALASGITLLARTDRAAPGPMGDPTKVVLKTTPVAGPISLVEGANGFAGGNVAVSVGNDGMFIVDDELQPLAAKLRVALTALSKKPLRFVINTHWHADHTGGNASVGAAGAVIIAHDNVRKRLSVDQFMKFMGKEMTFPAAPPEALPVVTFGDDITLHLNGDEVHVFHVPPAHTDGDSIVHFKRTNVIHMGDTFGTTGYPLVDAQSGGTFEGFITAADKVLPLCDAATKIIPGHGSVVGVAELTAWRDMLVKIRDRVAQLAAAKKTLDQIKAAKPTAEFDAQRGQGMVQPDQLVEWVYNGLPPAPAHPAAAKKPRK